jgi:hypothetical protein
MFSQNDDDVVRDGQSVRVRLDMMDGVQRAVAFDHQPHYARLTDAQLATRISARDAYVQRLSNAWRMDMNPGGDQPDDEAEPDNSSSPEVMRRHLQGRRDMAWERYKDQLGNAWKESGKVRPDYSSSSSSASTANSAMRRTERSAAAIERQRERWTLER